MNLSFFVRIGFDMDEKVITILWQQDLNTTDVVLIKQINKLKKVKN